MSSSGKEGTSCCQRFFVVIQRIICGDSNDEQADSYSLISERTPFKDVNPSLVRTIAVPQQTHRPLPFICCEIRDLELGEKLIFYEDGKVQVGLVAWTGYKTIQRQSFDNLQIVLQVESAYSSATNGIFEGQELVTPNDHKYYIMVNHKDTKKVPVFEVGDYCIVLDESIELVDRNTFHGGFITKMINDRYVFNPLNTDFRDDQESNNIYPAHRLRKAPIPECDIISDPVKPISVQQLDRFRGRNKGIQGRHNSCYLDTILFSFFAFSNHFDDVLFDEHSDMDSEYLMVLNLLRYNIVCPLRACHFVSFQHIQELRRLMSSKIDTKFQEENRDIPETMDALFRQLLQLSPFLSIGQSTNDQSFFDGSYTAECIRMENERFPTSELLLENATVQMDFSFEKMPNCFVLQLPRESERDGFVLPSYKLDLKNVLHKSVKVCHKCGVFAKLQFPNMIGRTRGLAGTFLCEDCAKNLNLDFSMAKQLPEPVISSLADVETEVEMYGLICIEKSHYNCYVRCGRRWVFFDSMSDQETLENPATRMDETFNIPLVEEVPKFEDWLKEAHCAVRKSNSLTNFFSSIKQSSECEYERAYRIFRFPYCIIYRKLNEF